MFPGLVGVAGSGQLWGKDVHVMRGSKGEGVRLGVVHGRRMQEGRWLFVAAWDSRLRAMGLLQGRRATLCSPILGHQNRGEDVRVMVLVVGLCTGC